MFASCCTMSPVLHRYSYRSHLHFKMSYTTATKEFWQEFIQLYASFFQPIFCPNTPFPLPVYGLFLHLISKNNCQTDGLWTCFRYDICQKTDVSAKLSYRVWTVSCCTIRCCANLFDGVCGPLGLVRTFRFSTGRELTRRARAKLGA